MKQQFFVETNRAKWDFYALESKRMKVLSPSAVSQYYLELSTDLAFAQTYYPKSDLVAYLEKLTLNYHQYIYQRNPTRWKEFLYFFTHDLPLACYEARRELWLTSLIFVVGALIGWVSQMGNVNFADLFFGESYMTTTRKNIVEGNPFGIYEGMGEFQMFWDIMWNNCIVGTRTFLSGLLTLFFTVFMLLRTGIMVGCFDAFFAQQGLLAEVLLVPNMHGVLELPAIIIAGGGGMVLGTSWLFPGHRSRLSAFRQGAICGVRLYLFSLFLFVIAAFIEGYLTRHTEFPIAVRATFVGIGLIVMSYYTLILPRQRWKATQVSTPSFTAKNPHHATPF